MTAREKLKGLCLLLAAVLLLCAGCAQPAPGNEAEPAATEARAPQNEGMPEETEPAPEPTPELTEAPDYAPQVVSSFMNYWSVGDYANMVSLCSVTWTGKKDREQAVSAMTELLEDRMPVSFEVTKVDGTNADLRRDARVTAQISKSGGPVQKYQFKLKVVWENNFWYIDPSGLRSYAGTPTPTARVIEVTQPPTPAPIDDPNTLLYYNPGGGKRYHLDPYCRTANERNLPFKGSFTFAELNNAEYADLIPCQICGAPRRPKK